ncbi:WD-repeat protein GhTTG1 [Gaertneriomyces semiglobifer]|nr:WD-repeat protein GhTTG1 [Gaertneriomyces semiglobifer]
MAQPGKELYQYQSQSSIYALNWCQRSGGFRVGLGTFADDTSNKIEIVELSENGGELVKTAEADHTYPCTKLVWSPYKAATGPDLLATTGDFLRLWEVSDAGGSSLYGSHDPSTTKLVKKAMLRNSRRTDPAGREFCAPITSMDWNELDPNMIITSSIDTTCTVWDLTTLQAKTQLIAHDREVYDVAWTRGSDVFASVGADGSLRMFDLRNLEHSTILYEVGPVPQESKVAPPTSQTSPDDKSDIQPLLRLSWNKQDPNYIATFQTDSSAVLILDIRVPAIPVCELRGHGAAVTAMTWAPHSSTHLCSGADDSQTLVWDVSQASKEKHIEEPLLAYGAPAPVNQVAWSSASPDWIAIAYGRTMETLRI